MHCNRREITPCSRAFQQASQFSAVCVSSSLKGFAATARCSPESEARFKHRAVKRLLRGPTVYEVESLPDEPAADRTDQAYDDRLDLSYTNDGNRRPGPATSRQKRSRRRTTDIAAWSS